MDYAKAYGAMHAVSDKVFSGMSMMPHVADITSLVGRLCVAPASISLLDYGCGKGYQYLGARAHTRWKGGKLPVCYDVGIKALSARPEGQFHGIIATDVLEHIAEEDVPTVLADIFSFVKPAPPNAKGPTSFVFLSICCKPAKKILPDGRNVHLTVKPPSWWNDQLMPFDRAGLMIQVAYIE